VIKEFAMKRARAHNFSIYEHVTFYENVEVGPPTKSNRGAPNETVTPLPLGHMQVCTLLQTNNHASTPPLIFLQAGCPSCRPTNSVKALRSRR